MAVETRKDALDKIVKDEKKGLLKRLAKEVNVCDVGKFTEAQSDDFDERADNDLVVDCRMTLNEATTLLELLREAEGVAMMRASKGYPKAILSTIVNCAEQLYGRMGLTTQKAFVKLHNDVTNTSGEEN